MDKALGAYNAGLYGGAFYAVKLRIDVGEDRKADNLGHAVVRRSVTIDCFDSFVTKRE